MTSVLFDGPGVVSCVRRGDAAVEGERRGCGAVRGSAGQDKTGERWREVEGWLRRLMCGRSAKFMQCLR